MLGEDLPGWIIFNGHTLEVTYAPRWNCGRHILALNLKNASNYITSAYFEVFAAAVDVFNSNYQLSTQFAELFQKFVFSLPVRDLFHFYDRDHIRIKAVAAPDWLSYNDSTLQFSGYPLTVG